MLTLRDLPTFELPYEKCIRRGVSALSDTELLAVILRTGTKEDDVLHIATKILSTKQEYKGLLVLNHLSLKELRKIKGIGNVKAVQLLCIAEITKRMSKATREEGVRLLSPGAVASYYMEDMRHLMTEQLMLLTLDSKSKLLSEKIISSGTVNASIASPREIFIDALQNDAVNIILLHNHPSGDPTPSKEDILTTNRVKDAGKLIGIQLMDHIIIGDNQYISLKERGLL